MKTFCVFCEVVTELLYTDTLRLTQFPVTKFQSYAVLQKVKEKICKTCAYCFLGGMKAQWNEYCWAITQASGRSCCVRSAFITMLESGFQLDFYVRTCVLKSDLRRAFRYVNHRVNSGCPYCVDQWYSTWGTRTPGGSRRHHRGHVKLKKYIYYFMINTE